MQTLQEVKDKLMQLDEITVLELLGLTSEDLVNRCEDLIENKIDYITGEINESTPRDND